MKNRYKKMLAAAADLPPSFFGECSFVEIEGQEMLKVSLCLEILTYGENEIRLSLPEALLTVYGRELTMCSYGNRAIRITGKIKGLFFDNGQEEKPS